MNAHCFHIHWGCAMMDDLRCDCSCWECTQARESEAEQVELMERDTHDIKDE